MRVVMVGHEGVGKTSYMSSMYREMATRGLHGFWVKARTDAEHRRLLSTAEGVARSRYPPPSEQRSAYALTLRHQGAALIDFTWSDYRGGVLREAKTAQSSEFIEDTRTADAVLLFIESADLIGRGIKSRARVRDLTNVAFQIIDGRERLVPIVVVVTKVDQVEGDEIPTDELLGFCEAVHADDRVKATITPVVCGPRPLNLLVPVMFSLFFGVASRAAELYQRAQFAEAIAQQASSQRTLTDWVKSKAKGELTNGEIAGLAAQQAEREYGTLQPLLGPVQALDYMLSDIQVF